jgi:hypothetical protein
LNRGRDQCLGRRSRCRRRRHCSKRRCCFCQARSRSRWRRGGNRHGRAVLRCSCRLGISASRRDRSGLGSHGLADFRRHQKRRPGGLARSFWGGWLRGGGWRGCDRRLVRAIVKLHGAGDKGAVDGRSACAIAQSWQRLRQALQRQCMQPQHHQGRQAQRQHPCWPARGPCHRRLRGRARLQVARHLKGPRPRRQTRACPSRAARPGGTSPSAPRASQAPRLCR